MRGQGRARERQKETESLRQRARVQPTDIEGGVRNRERMNGSNLQQPNHHLGRFLAQSWLFSKLKLGKKCPGTSYSLHHR